MQKCTRMNRKRSAINMASAVRGCFALYHLTCPLSHLSAEVSPTPRPEEEEGGEVRDGRDDRGAAHLYRLVPAALHVPRQVGSRGRQPTAGRVV